VTRIDIACAAEGRAYVAHTAAMLHSLLALHSEHEVHVHFLHGPELRAADGRRLAQMVHDAGAELSFLEIADEQLAGLPTKGFTGKATWYRLLLPDLRPDVDRMLYLDSDMLVVDSVAPLWDEDLSESYVGAVTNVIEPHYRGHPAVLGVEPVEAYFNAGTLLMNLDLMRRDDCTRTMFEYARANADKLLWRDQDVLNVVLGDRRLRLHPRWNCMNAVVVFPWAEEFFGKEAVDEACRNPAIRHFEGPGLNKPWHLLCDPELRAAYAAHRRATPWPRVRTEGVTPRNVLRRIKRERERRISA
jgi:lipopolysaccharide biosynthesis glycosyltransferase